MKKPSFKKSTLSIIAIGFLTVACSNESSLDLKMDSTTNSKSSAAPVSTNKSIVSTGSENQVAATSHTPTKTEQSKNVELTSYALEGIPTVDLRSILKAQSLGHSSEAIIAEILSSKLAVSEQALSVLGLSKYILKQYGASLVDGVLAMGLAAVDRARAAGVKDSEIITYAKLQGISFGESALSSLGLSKYILKTHGASSVEGVMAIGLAGVDRARAAGVKDSEIISYAKLQGVYFGESALSSLGLSKYILKTYGGAVVDGVFAIGLAAVDRARAAGLKDEEIKIYAKLQGIFFGEQALASLGV